MADINNLYILARRARDEGNTENAAKYYSQIVEIDPNDPEAYFYSVYYQVSNCKVGEIGVAANRRKAVFISTVELLKNCGSVMVGNTEKLISYADATIDLAKSLALSAENHYQNNSSVSGVADQTIAWISNCVNTICTVGDIYYELEEKNSAITCYQKADNITYGRVEIPYKALSRIKEVKANYISKFQKQKEENERKIAEMNRRSEELLRQAAETNRRTTGLVLCIILIIFIIFILSFFILSF